MMCDTKVFEFFFSEIKKRSESFCLDMFWYLIFKFPCRNTIVAFMCREWKGMELGNSIIGNKLFCIDEICFSFTRKSNNEISSYIDFYTIGPLYFFEFLENFPKKSGIIMSIHS
jgi:hypothetical protein